MRNALLVLGILALAVSFGAVASFGYAYNRFSGEMPDLGDYKSVELAQTSVVYDRNGDPVDELHGVQNRYVVGRGEISPNLRHAVVAIEDKRFYQHDGLDFEAIGRAAVSNLRNFSVRQGGSTITQQLIKNTYIDKKLRAVPSFQRKINEAALAWQYEDKHSKSEIINQYLNTVYFGQNAYGAEAASRTYFDKPAKDLTISEAAMLAGIINLPGTYDPFAYPVSAKKRRNVVLDKMFAQGMITKAQHGEAVASDLGVTRGNIKQKAANDYFLNAVRQEIIHQYGKQTLYQGGLDIYTTLDPDLQSKADETVKQVVKPDEGDPSAALVSIDPSTGAVRAMVGGSDFSDVQFNLATQAKRQPGSTFKTFVLAEAIKQGISLDTVYESKLLRIPLPGSDEVYTVDNYDHIRRGEIDLRKAIAASDNTVFVQLGLDLGMRKVIDMASAMGIKADLKPYPSTAIGGLGEGVSPFEMASAYSTLANGGVHEKPYLVRKVERSSASGDKVLEQHEGKEKRVLSKDEAATVTQALKGVVDNGTVSYYRDVKKEIGRESAGKTGTTDNFIDAWYIGYIPQLTTSVWVGYPNERRSMVNIRGYEQINGENFPLDIWSLYMQKVIDRYPEKQLAEPSKEFTKSLSEKKVGIPPDQRQAAKEKKKKQEEKKNEKKKNKKQNKQNNGQKNKQENTNSGGGSSTTKKGAGKAITAGELQDFLNQSQAPDGGPRRGQPQNTPAPAARPASPRGGAVQGQPGAAPSANPSASPQVAPRQGPQVAGGASP